MQNKYNDVSTISWILNNIYKRYIESSPFHFKLPRDKVTETHHKLPTQITITQQFKQQLTKESFIDESHSKAFSTVSKEPSVVTGKEISSGNSGCGGVVSAHTLETMRVNVSSFDWISESVRTRYASRPIIRNKNG
jgi:hypothetical protein